MTYRSRHLMKLLTTVLLILSLESAPAVFAEQSAAQRSGSSYKPGRLWDNKTPDFRGIWQVRDTAYVNIEGHSGGKGIAPAKSIIVDPPNGKIPYTAEALAKRQENYKSRMTADPSIKCYQSGVPRATYAATPLQIIQSPGNFVIVYQENHAFRYFYPEPRPHFRGADWWMGDTRYHWEGDTLVTSVSALTDKLWLDQAGNYFSLDVNVHERYTMTGPDTLQYEATIEDAKVYTRPWTIRTVLHRLKDAGARLIEDECLEDENGIHRHISPYDPKNLLKNDYRRWRIADAVSKNKK
ncbi:MAG: hypothetical protein AUH28_10550 [Acidobacteria bacterium 13_1_40CM_56_16]|nr:MAG: hypothetical protein AUH28_10550 [Acidobacteria bacterium 13_1_40CM_56_16]